MHRNQALFDFLTENLKNLTGDWYNSIEDTEPDSVYSTDNPAVINDLKSRGHDFFLHLSRVFIEDETYFFSDFKAWSEDLAKDEKHLDTPVQYVVRQFMKCQEVIINYVKSFYLAHASEVSLEQFLAWYDLVIKAVSLSIYTFIDQYHKNATGRLTAQRELIAKLSSPVITLQNQIALLPLVGDIASINNKIILENTLNQCAEKGVRHLCIDLLGVATIDTAMAHEIFDLIKALELIGVKSTLSGIRPEIAQTAVRLGLPFQGIHTTSSLSQALSTIV
ncbi:STAS domain-containing protein [Priestia megaterium]|nr:STAS domain-containing protein [Priestia megaterium]